jgi:hypothetical protein
MTAKAQQWAPPSGDREVGHVVGTGDIDRRLAKSRRASGEVRPRVVSQNDRQADDAQREANDRWIRWGGCWIESGLAETTK